MTYVIAVLVGITACVATCLFALYVVIWAAVCLEEKEGKIHAKSYDILVPLRLGWAKFKEWRRDKKQRKEAASERAGHVNMFEDRSNG